MRPVRPRARSHVAFAALAATLVLSTSAGVVSEAAAADVPVPKVMSDAPPDRGRWRMEMLEMNGRDTSSAQQRLGGDMTVCMTAAEAVARREGANDARRCDTRLAEDTAARAVLEVSCPGTPPTRTRSTITRDGERSYLVATDVQGEHPTSMKMRMSYAGTCAAGDRVVSLGRDSAVCREAREKVASGEAARQCASGGADEATCRARIAQAQARIESLCR